ncbi:hypothetical protein ACLOJK_032882 [Asimina triloba]
MPTVSVGRDRLFAALGKSYTQEEFEELCFEFGIELDDVVSTLNPVPLRFEYECMHADFYLRVQTTEKAIIRKEKHLEDEDMGEDEEVIYKIDVPANRYDLLCLEGLVLALRIFVGSDKIPKYTVIDTPIKSMLKMHVKPEALPPSEINFVPLKQTRSFRADALMEFYKSDLKLKKFLHIIENSPVYPVIYDSNRTVLSLPPIINGAHSAITLKTKNVFIECTATDLTKANIVLNTMVEPVQVVYHDGKTCIYPDLSLFSMEVPLSYITGSIGAPLAASEVTALLNKMQLHAEQSAYGKSNIIVSVPPTRSDVLHACDVMEDVAIAYGYNKIPKTKPASMTQGRQQPLNQISDLIRLEVAMTGFTEVLTWILCSYKENFSMLNRIDDRKTAVIIGNPRSSDFEIFEVGDIVLLDDSKDVGAANRRQLAALYCNSKSGFEVIHGLLDRIMQIVGIPFVPVGDDTGYYIRPSHEPEFFPGRQASIIFKGKRIGVFGIVHPEESFQILLPLESPGRLVPLSNATYNRNQIPAACNLIFNLIIENEFCCSGPRLGWLPSAWLLKGR